MTDSLTRTAASIAGSAPGRRLRLLAPALALASLLGCGGAAAFGLEQVAARARSLAEQPYVPPAPVPEELRELSYDRWRDIRFRPERALWRDTELPFQVQFFHTGLFYDRAVTINVVDADGPRRLAFDPALFDYGDNRLADLAAGGFAGFRIHGPIKRADYYDEIAVFLGASYLRAVGAPHVYGLSARGIAVDTASPQGEEFPWFREFWLVRPQPGDAQLTVYALLDGPSLTGAYRYVIRPGEQTVMDVSSRLFPRKPIDKLGVAPLTSMFFYGEARNLRPVDDFRPEVHDSDGLLVAMDNGEQVWRPLRNPSRLTSNAFVARNPRGYGLQQRDQRYAHYLDLEANYHRRPSAWVEPRGDWGRGHVELVQIPTENEVNDNIVAYWVPEAAVEPGQPLAYDYRLHWHQAGALAAPLARVTATRTSRQAPGGAAAPDRLFVVEFDGPRLQQLNAGAELEPRVEAQGPVQLTETRARKNPVTGGWRLAFRLRRTGGAGDTIKELLDKDLPPVELRAALHQGGARLTETWSYTLLD